MGVAVDIVGEALTDIRRDLRGALVCLAPAISVMALWFFGIAIVRAKNAGLLQVHSQTLSEHAKDSILLYMLAASVILFLAANWSAVAWHRKVILSERTGRWFPFWSGGIVIRYAVRGFTAQIPWLLMVVFLILPLGFLTSDTFQSSIKPANTAGNKVLDDQSFTEWIKIVLLFIGLPMAVHSIFFCIMLRSSIALPAVAIGRPITEREAWKRSRGSFTRVFLPLGMLMFAVFIAINIAVFSRLSLKVASVMTTGLLALLGLAAFLLGISVLTRLYIYFHSPEELSPATPGGDNDHR